MKVCFFTHCQTIAGTTILDLNDLELTADHQVRTKELPHIHDPLHPQTNTELLHDRMPVILENGSEEIRTWLDPKRSTWSKDLRPLETFLGRTGDISCE